MFLSRVKFPKIHSITSRLTLLYTIATAILLVIVCSFSYLALSQIVLNGNKTFLSDEMNLIEQVITHQPNDFASLKQHVNEIPKVLYGSVYRFYIRVSDEKDKELFSTKDANIVLYDDLKQVKSGEFYWARSHNGDDFFVMHKSFKVNLNQIINVQIALNVSYQYQLISDFRNKEYFRLILFIFILGIASAIFLGYVVAKNGLKQLFVLAKTTENIKTTSLNQRLDYSNWPSELKRVGLSFNQMLTRIEADYAKLSQFSADLAHELRTPINNLLGQTEIVLSKEYSVDEYKKVLVSNIEDMQHISSIIENILFLAREESNSLNLNKSKIMIHQEIMTMIEFFQIMAEEKKIIITLEGEGIIKANPIMFRRILSNLLSNAVRYTPENGKIHFDIKSIDNKFVEISISDTGIGIAPEHLPNIGNRFYRVSSDRSADSGGVGLGLAIVKSIVEMHAGNFCITSEINKGTRIVMNFPLL